MKLGMIIRESRDAKLELVESFGITHFIQNYQAHKTPMDKEKRPSTFIPAMALKPLVSEPRTNIDSIADSIARKFDTVFVDFSGGGRAVEITQQFSERLIHNKPEIKIGITSPLVMLIDDKQKLAERFRSANYFPVAVLGNGQVSVSAMLDLAKSEYQNVIPCVMALEPIGKATIGDILLNNWENFDELIFWSPMTLLGVDLAGVKRTLAEKRLIESQRYKCLTPTYIRESPSLNSRTKGRTEPGTVYAIVDFIGKDVDPIYAKLKDGTYVVFDQTHFQKETDQ